MLLEAEVAEKTEEAVVVQEALYIKLVKLLVREYIMLLLVMEVLVEILAVVRDKVVLLLLLALLLP